MMMKKLLIITLFLINIVHANDIYVISNQPISISKSELKSLFFAKTVYLKGQRFHIVSNEEGLSNFAKIAFDISSKKLTKKWIKQNFRKGIPFPVTKDNDLETIQWVKSQKNTLGFVSKKPDGVAVVYTFSKQ